MRIQPLSLFVFATVCLSCAFSQDAGNAKPTGLVGPGPAGKYLEKKKPPPNVPGPKLSLKDLDLSRLVGIHEHEELTKKLMSHNPDKGWKKQARLTKNKKSPFVGPQRAQNNEENLLTEARSISDRNEKENQRTGAGLPDSLD